MIRAWLIRHGESESNAGLPSSDPARSPLTPLGHQQAAQVARTLVQAPALIVTSPFVRAWQTAQPTIGAFPRSACQEWPVQEFTYLGGLRWRTMTASEREPYARAYWDRADPRRSSDGAESFADLIDRAHEFLGRLRAQQAGPVAVFTHGHFMRAVAWSLLTGITSPDSPDMRDFRRFGNRYLIPNGAIVEVRYGGDGPVLLGGSAAHLPVELTTGT